ncbi:MAG TPA: metallopeptidase family protein [Thermoanaerobaculia bacterium]
METALEQLPPQFRDLLDNVAVMVEEEPGDEDYELADADAEGELLGIFRGIARTDRSWEQLPALPNTIAIFRGPILRISSSRAEAVREIRETVVHELGHYFGLGDDEMIF